MKVSLAIFVLITLFVVNVATADNSINTPQSGEKVAQRPFVKGKVTGKVKNVWVIVHPMNTSDYWVQPKVTVKKNSSWNVQIYIGRPGKIDVGKHFEIMAVSDPTEKLMEGKVLGRWPAAQSKSDVIEVVRK